MLRAVLAILLTTASFAAGAQESRLHVALFDVAPYAYQSGGALRGMYVGWVQELLAGLNIRADIELLPFARIPLALEQQRADITISFSTEALDQAAVALGPVLRVDSLIVTSVVRPARQLADLKDAQIGRARGGCQDLAKRADLHLRWTEVNGFENGLRMLEMGRLDGLCLTRDVLQHSLRSIGIKRSQLGPEIVVSQRTAFLYARKSLDPQIVARLQAAVSRRTPMLRD